MLSRLIYASETTDPVGPAPLAAILEASRRNNARRGLTGLLAYSSANYLQVIEGDRHALSELLARIVADPRHRRPVLLGFEAIERRLFPGWTMGFAAADATRRAVYLRHGRDAAFTPADWTAAGALGVLQVLAAASGAEPAPAGG